MKVKGALLMYRAKSASEYIMTPLLAKIGKDKWHRRSIKRIYCFWITWCWRGKPKTTQENIRSSSKWTAYSQTFNVSLDGIDGLRSSPKPEPGPWLEARTLLHSEEAIGLWRLQTSLWGAVSAMVKKKKKNGFLDESRGRRVRWQFTKSIMNSLNHDHNTKYDLFNISVTLIYPSGTPARRSW